MGRITINELSSDLKEYLNGLGLTEAQVQELIDKFEDEKIGDISQLNTNSKDLVGAINELFQNANNGKELIANAIGNPLINVDSTFNAMSEAILGLRKESGNETDVREVLYNMMVEDGYDSATSEMNVDELIDLLDRSGIGISDIKQIACGDFHTFIIKNNGSLWACGNNDKGQLGLNDTNNRTTFTQVTTNINNDVTQVNCGDYHTFIIKKDGSVWACGLNDKGQLGLGNNTNKSTFTQVTTNINNDVKQIACREHNSTFILKNDGSLWSCGHNEEGQLGLGDNTNRSTFTQVTTNINNDVKQVVRGGYHTIILKNDGSVWGCGGNGHGQLGLGDTISKTTFTKVITNINNDVEQVICGSSFTYLLKNDGSVWSCGRNAHGQLGLGNTTDRTTFTQVTTNISNVKQIACGAQHAFIIKNDGSVYSCGNNTYGQLGLNDNTNRSTFTQVTTNINNGVEYVVCGENHVIIIKKDGSVWACGLNDKGQLGLGNYTNRSIFNNTNFSTGLSEYDIDKLALYNYLLSNDIPVTESMDIGTMLNLLVDDYINKMILGYENNLKIILTDEDVSITEEDNMDSLIAKVDEEFNEKNTEVSSLNTTITLLNNQVNSLTNELAGKVTPAGNAVAGDVLSGKTFINSTGQVVTGSIVNRGGAQTVTPGTSNKTLNAGYYSGNITIAGDADLVAANIVSGKNIFGVTGTATKAPTATTGTAYTFMGPSSYSTTSPHTNLQKVYTASKAIPVSGTYTCKFNLSYSGYYSSTVRCQIRKTTGTVILNVSTAPSYAYSFSETISLTAGDVLELWLQAESYNTSVYISEFTISCTLNW